MQRNRPRKTRAEGGESAGSDHLAEADVDDLELHVAAGLEGLLEEDVFELEVAVDDAALVEIGDGREKLADHASDEDLADGVLRPAAGAVLVHLEALHPGEEFAAAAALHDEHAALGAGEEVEQLDDVAVIRHVQDLDLRLDPVDVLKIRVTRLVDLFWY